MGSGAAGGKDVEVLAAAFRGERPHADTAMGRATATPRPRALEDAAGAEERAARHTALAGLVLFIAAAQSMLVAMLAGALAPGYSLNGNAISDLGVIPQTAAFFNTSLVVTGVLTAGGGWLLRAWLARDWVVALFVLAGLGSVGVGLVTVERSPETHQWLALAAFLGFGLLPAACAPELRGWMRPLSLLAAVVGVAYLVVMILGTRTDGAVFGDIGAGGTERMVIYPAMLWMMAFGGYLMRRDFR